MDIGLSPERLRASAEFAMSVFREQLNCALDFDRSGVEWIDGYIERVRDSFPRHRRSGLVFSLGAVVGESIIRNFGGEWIEDDGKWGVQLTEQFWADPFAKIEKQFEYGSAAGDTVLGFYECTPILIAHLDRNPHA